MTSTHFVLIQVSDEMIVHCCHRSRIRVAVCGVERSDLRRLRYCSEEVIISPRDLTVASQIVSVARYIEIGTSCIKLTLQEYRFQVLLVQH